MELNYQCFPDDFLALSVSERKQSNINIPIIIIPGLFGSIANWRGFAKRLAEFYPVIVLDLRNHGGSPHVSSHSYIDMVNDLDEFVKQHQLESITVCGHSMGGKVAMLFALLHPEKVEKLAVLDIAPVEYTHSHAPFLQELNRVDLSQLQSRRDADVLLAKVIPDTGTRLFLLQNLAGTSGCFHWRINVPVLLEFMPQIVGFPNEEIAGVSCLCQTIFILGGQSDYVKPHDYDRIGEIFKNVGFRKIDNAGHWVHADKPNELYEVLIEFLKK